MAKQKQSPPPPAVSPTPAATVTRGAPDRSKSIFAAKNESVLSAISPQDRFLYDVAREWFNYEYATEGSSVADNPAMAAGMQRYRALRQSLTPKQIEEVNNFISGNNPAWLFFLEGATGNQFYFTPSNLIPNGAPQSTFFPASGAFARPGTSFVNSNQNANQTPIVVNQASAQANPVKNNYTPPPQSGTTFKSLLNAEMQSYIQEFVPQDNTVRKSALLKVFSGQPMTLEEAAWVSQNAASDYNVAHTMQYYRDVLDTNADQAKRYASQNQNDPILTPDVSALGSYALQYFQPSAPAAAVAVAPPMPAAVAAAPPAPAAVAVAPPVPAAVAVAPPAPAAAVPIQPSWDYKNVTAADVQARAQQAMMDAEIVSLFASSDPEELALFTSAAKFINTGEAPEDPIEAQNMFGYIQSESPLWMSYVKKNYGDPYRFASKSSVNAAIPSASGTASNNNFGKNPGASTGTISVPKLTEKEKEAAILQEAKRMTAEQNRNAAYDAADEKGFAEEEIKNKEIMAAMEAANVYSDSFTASMPQEQMYDSAIASLYDRAWRPFALRVKGNIIPSSPKLNTVASIPQGQMYGPQIGSWSSENYVDSYPQMYQAGASNAPPLPPLLPPYVPQNEMYSWLSQGNAPKLNTVASIPQEQMYGPQTGSGFPENSVDSYPQMYQAGASNAPPSAPPSPPLPPSYVPQNEMYSWPSQGNVPKLNTVSSIPQGQMYGPQIGSGFPENSVDSYPQMYQAGVSNAPPPSPPSPPLPPYVPQAQMYGPQIGSWSSEDSVSSYPQMYQAGASNAPPPLPPPYAPQDLMYSWQSQGYAPKPNTVSRIPQGQMYGPQIGSGFPENYVDSYPQMYQAGVSNAPPPAPSSPPLPPPLPPYVPQDEMYSWPSQGNVPKLNTVSSIPQGQMYGPQIGSGFPENYVDSYPQMYQAGASNAPTPFSPKLNTVSRIPQEKMYGPQTGSGFPENYVDSYPQMYQAGASNAPPPAPPPLPPYVPQDEMYSWLPQGNAPKLNTVSSMPQEQMYGPQIGSAGVRSAPAASKLFDPARGLYEALENGRKKLFDPARGLYEALESARKKQVFDRRPARWGGY